MTKYSIEAYTNGGDWNETGPFIRAGSVKRDDPRIRSPVGRIVLRDVCETKLECAYWIRGSDTADARRIPY
jgi:hypothetical protein